MTDESLAKFFSEKLGLESKKALETTKNAKLSTHLQSLAAKAGIENAENEQQQNKKVGLLLYGLAAFLAKDPPNFPPSKTEFLLKYITSSNAGGSDELCIKSDAQLNAALKYLSAATVVDASKIDEDDFKSSCGIGVKAPTHSEIKAAVETLIEQNQEQLKLHRYAFDMGALLRKLREDDIMRWADGKLLKTVFDDAIEGFLGPKLESDLKAKVRQKNNYLLLFIRKKKGFHHKSHHKWKLIMTLQHPKSDLSWEMWQSSTNQAKILKSQRKFAKGILRPLKVR